MIPHLSLPDEVHLTLKRRILNNELTSWRTSRRVQPRGPIPEYRGRRFVPLSENSRPRAWSRSRPDEDASSPACLRTR